MRNFIFQKILKLFCKNDGLSEFCYSVFITILGIGVLSYPILNNLIVVVISFILLILLYSINLFIEIKLNNEFNITVFINSFSFLKSNNFICYFGQFYITETMNINESHRRQNYFNYNYEILNNKNKLNSTNGYPSLYEAHNRLYKWHSNGVLIHSSKNHQDLDEKKFNILKNQKFFDL